MSRTFAAVLAAVFIALVNLGSIPAQSAPIIKHIGDTPEARRAKNALNILESQGYADLQSKSASAFDQFVPDGDEYTAQISQSGRQFAVRVNPDTGRLTRLR